MARDLAPTGLLLNIDGVQVHAHQEGMGRDVILLHGAGGNTRDFTFDLMGRLAGDFRVTAFDRPGLGHTDPLHPNGESPAEQAAVLETTCLEMGLGPAVLVGHSFGGSVALAWALDYPARAAAVVSLAGAALPWQGGLGPYYEIVSSSFGAAFIVPMISAFVPRFVADQTIARIFEPDAVPEGYADHIGIELSLRPDTLRANTRQVNGLKPHIRAMAERYGELPMPIEILHGTADSIVPIDVHARPFVEKVPTARLTELDGVGHMPHHADPEAAVAAIRRAVARSDLRAAG